MTYAEINPPLAEPITLAEVKAHLRLDGSDEDALLLRLIRVAREHLEKEAGLCLMARTLRLYLDGWPKSGVLHISRGPVISLQAVTVYDGEGVAEAHAIGGHLLDGVARPARLWLPQTPDPGRAINGIEVDFIAGFGETAADVPDGLKRAMLMHVALMFAWRGAVPLEHQPAAIPQGYERLIAPHARRRL